MKSLLSPLVIILLLLSGCSTIPESTETPIKSEINIEDRNKQLAELTRWQVSGKIGFIKNDERNSATITWYKDSLLNTQRLDLTKLGINILSLTSANNQHQLEFNGENYKTQNLEALIYRLTGYYLPTEALSYWLKGQAYLATDVISYETTTQLPDTLESEYDNKIWLINYSGYQEKQGYILPTKLTVKQANMTIKISISEWDL